MGNTPDHWWNESADLQCTKYGDLETDPGRPEYGDSQRKKFLICEFSTHFHDATYRN